MVSGPGIEMLQRAMHDMAGRGAPTEYNDYGFGKTDYETYHELELMGHLDRGPIPVSAAARMLRILSHYQNTQVKNYREIAAMVQRDVSGAQDREGEGSSESAKVVVYDRQPLEYGKVKVYVPNGLDRSATILINRELDARLAAEGEQKTEDAYGNMKYPRYKKLSQDKSSIHAYRVHPSVMGPFLKILASKGLEVQYESGASTPPAATQERVPEQNPAEPDVTILGQEKNQYGNKLAVSFNYQKSKGLFQKMKDAGLAPKAIAYAGNGKFLINIDDAGLFSTVVSKIQESGLDVSPVLEFAKTNGIGTEAPGSTGSGVVKKEGVIRFSDAARTSITVKTDVRGLPQESKDFIRESIQYTFPDYRYDMSGHYYTISGTYKQYVTFGRLLKRFGYPVDELREIVKTKLRRGDLKETEWEGKYDRDKEFQDSIESKVPESMVDLYDEQKFGVAFLYGRDSAILGDSTGFGKSIQLITAAALRMQSNPKPTLIITLKDTQKQFAGEIVRVMGDKEKDQISLDPMNPKKWTVIKYSDFSGGKAERNDKVRQHVESLRRAGFGVAILDELHKVKHGTSQRSINIASVVDDIPTRWGASATVSSNKPMDVKNQLLMMGHQLGRVKDGKFKKDFAGMVEGGYGGSLRKSDNEEDEIRAAERLNKWLNLSGVYVRREKEDVRKMPELSVGSDATGIDQGRFQAIYSSKLQGYKDPDLAVSKLIAAREAVAQLKTDETTKKVLDIVGAGEGKPPAASKVVVFTNFIEAGRQLVDKVSSGLKSLNPNYSAITYLSDTSRKEREQVKRRFTDDPNIKVLIMSMKMGGTGIDFPNAAQHMVINDFDWTPESAEQSEGRIYRINTDHAVNIRYVVGEGLDKELFERVQRKREIAAIIQKYRREYHDNEHATDALKKIVDAQKELKKIDGEMAKIVAAKLPGAEDAIKESFSAYVNRVQAFSEALFPSE